MKISSAVSVVLTAACYGAAFTPSALSYAPSQWGMKTRRSPLAMKQEGKSLSLGNLFSGENGSPGAPTLRGNKNLEPHPSVRPHISALNRLGPDKQKETKTENHRQSHKYTQTHTKKHKHTHRHIHTHTHTHTQTRTHAHIHTHTYTHTHTNTHTNTN